MAKYNLEQLAASRLPLPHANRTIARRDAVLGAQAASSAFSAPVRRSGMGKHPRLRSVAQGVRT